MRKVLFLIKKILSNQLFKFFQSSSAFNQFIDDALHKFYEIHSLTSLRIWGDKGRLQIGNHAQLNNAIINTISGKVVIGDYTFFGHNVCLITGTHDFTKFDLERQTQVPQNGRDIIIGKGVWIALNVLITGPCEIGDNTVVGANSYITGKVEANALYAGSPAKKIKTIEAGISDV